MFEFFKKKRVEGERGQLREAVLGFACGIKNATLRIDWFGSPVELGESARREASLPLAAIVQHIDSEVSLFRISQKEPVLQWHGGPHAERLMHFLDAVASDDTQAVAEFADLLDPSVDGSHVALIAAAHRGQHKMVEALIGAGASVNAAGALGMSALHWASTGGHEGVTSVLLKAGANDAASNWFCLTPVELAVLNDHASLAQKQLQRSRVRGDTDWQSLTVERMREL